MAAVTKVRERYDQAGHRKIRDYEINIAASGDTLATGLGSIEHFSVENPQNEFVVEGTLVGGTVTVADARIAAADRAVVSRESNAGTDGHLEANPGAGDVVVTSSAAGDTSVVKVLIIKPKVTKTAKSGGTLTFTTDPSGAVSGVLVSVRGR